MFFLSFFVFSAQKNIEYFYANTSKNTKNFLKFLEKSCIINIWSLEKAD